MVQQIEGYIAARVTEPYSNELKLIDVVDRSDIRVMIATAVTEEAKRRKAYQWKSAVRRPRRKH